LPPDEVDVTDEQAISLGYETFRLLRQLSTSGKAKYLDEVRRYGPGVAFDFQSHADFFQREFIQQLAPAPDFDDYLMSGADAALGDNNRILG
jgi:hypothetical protein